MKGRVKTSVFRDLYQQPYSDLTRVKLYNSTKGSLDLVQRLRLFRKLPIHNGCVNSLCWNETGEYLLSGSDDQHLVVTHGYKYRVLSNYKTSHRANIFSAKFLPACGDTSIISCSGDGIILYTDLLRKEDTHFNQFNCHSGTTYEVITVPNDPNSFLSCGEDGTVRWFDLRIKNKCTKPHCKEDIMITCPRAVTSLSISPLVPYHLAIGCSDSTVRMFDRRMLTTKATGGPDSGPAMRPMCSFTVPSFGDRSYRITSLCFSPEGDELLVSYSSDHLYLFNVKEESVMKLNSDPSSNLANQEKEKRSRSPPPVRRLRLRGDWSDTGPDARPEREGSSPGDVAQARPTLHATLMQRMTDVLTRMLNDPATRAALSGGGEDSLEREDANVRPPSQNNTSPSTESDSAQPPEPLESATTVLTVSPISVPQMSSLSLNSSERDGNSSAVSDRDEETATMNASVSGSNVLDLRCVQCGAGSSDNECEQSGACSSALPGSGECGCAPSVEADPSANQIQETEEEAMTRGESDMCGSSYQPRMNFIQRKISSLQDKLSTLREGFIERHGSEPAVRLMYSEKSSSNATISLGVADEVSRNLHSDSRPSVSTTGSTNNEDTNVLTASGSGQGTLPDEQEPQPGPSTVQCATGVQKQSNFNKERYSDSDDDEEDDNDSIVNDHCYLLSKNNFSKARGYVHPIEEHMEDAINAARGEKKSLVEDKDSYHPLIKQKFTGHRNARTMIKEATFWGNNFVLSGSDCGHVFIWDRFTGSLVMLLEADRHVVNCLQPHPILPLLATSGIDYDVKLWAPLHEEPSFDKDLADVLTKRNEVMLEETKDTITVPASFMIRMLACLNQIRRGGRNRARSTRRQNYDDNVNN
ncbi:WD repeat-containing protein 82 [Gryllus bimaculatus]|nr:WD repeat-containing protein 82 [Gryllus bimaculatus]